MTAPLLIDCLQLSRPERERFLEWRRGGLGCVHVTLSIWENARETIAAIGRWNRMFAAHGDLIAPAASADEIEAVAASGRTAVVFGFQNSAAFEDDIDLVEIFHRLGVRIAQLTYNLQNSVGAGCWEDDSLGLAPFFGRNLVREMNRCGMLIDISHCNPKTGFDALALSERPIAITHANPAEFVGTGAELARRNKPTALIEAVAKAGGVIGLSMYPKLLAAGTSLADFCRMVEWAAERFGIGAVAFGSDFHAGHPEDVVTWWRAGRWARESPLAAPSVLAVWPGWFPSPAAFPAVLDGLRQRGFREDDIARIAGGNWLRLFAATFAPQGGDAKAPREGP